MSTDPATIIDATPEQALGGEPEAAPQYSEVEQIALDKGWRPEDQFKGDKAQWRSAGDFLRKIRTDGDLKREIKGLSDQVQRIASASSRQTKRALDEQATEIQARFDAAVENKDRSGAAKAAKEMQDLSVEAREVAAPTGNVEADFARDNPWYGTNDEATAIAAAVSQREFKKGKSVEDQLSAATDAVKKRFPELFEGAAEPGQQPQSRVAAPTRGPAAKREKGYGDLPPAARKAADDYADLFAEKHGKNKDESRKQYAKDFFADVEA